MQIALVFAVEDCIFNRQLVVDKKHCKLSIGNGPLQLALMALCVSQCFLQLTTDNTQLTRAILHGRK